jgi:hypothetical protein
MMRDEEGNPIVEMRKPDVALSILSCCDEKREKEKPLLCICCQNSGTKECTHPGQRKVGICEGYTLDERDIPKTYGLVLAFLQG